MWKTLEERNLAIIEAVMQDLGVIDIEELPAKVHELKEAAQQSEQGITCMHPKSTIIGTMSYCDTCGEVVA